MTFFTLICCKNCIVCLKKTKNKRKRGWVWPIFLKKYLLLLRTLEARICNCLLLSNCPLLAKLWLPQLLKHTQQVKYPNCEAGVLTVLDELAQMGKATLLGLWVLLNNGDDRVSNGSFVFLHTKKKLNRQAKSLNKFQGYYYKDLWVTITWAWSTLVVGRKEWNCLWSLKFRIGTRSVKNDSLTEIM